MHVGGACRAGVFDGHRGPEAAAYAAEHFVAHLKQDWRKAASPELALRRAFVSLDNAFARQQACSLNNFLFLCMFRMGVAVSSPFNFWHPSFFLASVPAVLPLSMMATPCSPGQDTAALIFPTTG